VHAFLAPPVRDQRRDHSARAQGFGRSQSQEARIILGAAVIDDVLGLVVLAVVTARWSNASSAQGFAVSSVLLILAKAARSGGLARLGCWSRAALRLASRLKARQVLLAVGLAFCFLFAWLADAWGCAIVGAFAAGLVLEDVHDAASWQRRADFGRADPSRLGFLAPIFFVLMA